MQGTSQGKNDPKCVNSQTGLGRCLFEGDPKAALRDHRTRRKTFGVSLAIETLLLGMIVATPLLTSGAHLEVHQIPTPQLTFVGAWREHNTARHVATPVMARQPLIPNPY